MEREGKDRYKEGKIDSFGDYKGWERGSGPVWDSGGIAPSVGGWPELGEGR